ncbi:MAG TPA: bifunctional nuclease family protein [Planctomycetota bacterium]|nr:bifunctional nuclease family protein [Planctomycetota bacterium]
MHEQIDRPPAPEALGSAAEPAPRGRGRAKAAQTGPRNFFTAAPLPLANDPGPVIIVYVTFVEVAPVVHMELSRIIISETNDEQVIVLKEVEGERAFPIVIGIWEAVAIDRNIKGKKTPRPMTHDLLENVIGGLDSKLDRVIVTELRDRTFYAKLILRRNGKTVEVDSRPSDAIALAVQMRAPIYVEEQVLEEVIHPPGQGGPADSGPEEEGDSGEEEQG